MALPDEELHYFLTEDGWKAGSPPLGCLATIIFFSPEEMYSKGYWGTLRVLVEGAASEAAFRKFGRRPKSTNDP
ncbi:MAG: hypothetical protein ABW061_19350 [Polyangiaceae bacterium]